MTRLKIIEMADRNDFALAIENFIDRHRVHLESVKFQRNLYYKGIGSSAGRTPGSTKSCDEAKLDESYVAFLLWEE
jgi:hypothetical protein